VYNVAIDKPAEPVHIVRETSLLLGPLGIEPIGEHPRGPAERLRIAIPEGAAGYGREIAQGLFQEGRRPIVALNISGSSPEKFLGVEKYIAVGRGLIEAGFTPVFAGAPADRDSLAMISERSGALMFPITRNFAEFAALLDQADLISTPDTSVVHVAAALGKPAATMVPSGATGAGWGPWGVPSAILSGNGSVADIRAGALLHSIISLASATVGPRPPSSAS
jgi:ADP-heptose:LPS heptosyltransferase